MKKAFITIFVYTCFHISTSTAQEYQRELTAGYGVLSGLEIGVAIGDALGASIEAGLTIAVGDIISILVNGTPTNVTVVSIESSTRNPGNFSIGYNKYLSKRWAFGPQITYTPIISEHTILYSNGTSSSSSSRSDFISPNARLSFAYIVGSKFRLYSAASAGIVIELSDKGDYGTWLHLTGLGFAFGKKNTLNLELGVGVGPFINAMYAIRF
jgi:hypothetical protein